MRERMKVGVDKVHRQAEVVRACPVQGDPVPELLMRGFILIVSMCAAVDKEQAVDPEIRVSFVDIVVVNGY